MSADNGIYILRTPARPIKSGNMYTNQKGDEYRVAESTDSVIEGYEFSDLLVASIFGDSEVFTVFSNAMEYARSLLEDLSICEYGIITISRNSPFPNISCGDAAKALNSYIEDAPDRPCVFCGKMLKPVNNTWSTMQPLCGGEVQFIFAYGSMEFDDALGSTKFRGIICDQCGLKLVPHMDEM